MSTLSVGRTEAVNLRWLMARAHMDVFDLSRALGYRDTKRTWLILTGPYPRKTSLRDGALSEALGLEWPTDEIFSLPWEAFVDNDVVIECVRNHADEAAMLVRTLAEGARRPSWSDWIMGRLRGLARHLPFRPTIEGPRK